MYHLSRNVWTGIAQASSDALPSIYIWRQNYHYYMKSVPTLNGHNFASFWARDSSKKAFRTSWLALSNGMKFAGNARRAVHVQGDWKLYTCAARRVPQIFKFATRYRPGYQLNETNRTVPNLRGCKTKVQTEICSAKIHAVFFKWETEPGICENLKNLASRWQAVPLIFKRSKRLCVRKTREFSCDKMRTTDAHRTSNQNQACGCSTCRSQCPEHEDNFLFEIGLKLTELRGITLLRAKATLSHLEPLLGYISKIHWLDRCPHLLCTTCKKPHANIF